jgi:hypothetical protein
MAIFLFSSALNKRQLSVIADIPYLPIFDVLLKDSKE